MQKSLRAGPALAACVAPLCLAGSALASDMSSEFTPKAGVDILGAPLEFFLFGATLVGVALLHHRTFTVAFTGLAAIIAYKFFFTGFKFGAGLDGLLGHLWHERVILSNLFLLLIGFAVLSRHFEDSKAPEAMPRILPDDWTGGLALLAMVFALSSFLDNIAAALIGGVVARHVYKHVHIGYLAAIVASSNAGGAGSVVGDTTTTMMWIDGVSPLDVIHAYVASITAFIVFAVPLAIVQQRHSPIQKQREGDFRIDWARVGVVAFILLSAIGANVSANLYAPHLLDAYPVIGLGVWAAIMLGAAIRAPEVSVIPANLKGTLFLLALVLCASLMPVEKLPPASWESALALGFISSVFDNIPLTALALKQGGYDWGVLAFAVGFGGSMLWFGSSAGVALSNQYPEAKSAVRWVRSGWWVALGYVVGFFALLAVMGWTPHAPHKPTQGGSPAHSSTAVHGGEAV
jgi:Na+/H+ antiporter NhaD/arsenite permease-like protein